MIKETIRKKKKKAKHARYVFEISVLPELKCMFAVKNHLPSKRIE